MEPSANTGLQTTISEGRIHKTYGLKADGSPPGDGKYLYKYDQEGRRSKIWTFNEFGHDNIATNVTIYEYVNDDIGNWLERHEYHLWRDDSYQSKRLTTRTLTYYEDNPRFVRIIRTRCPPTAIHLCKQSYATSTPF